MAETYPEPRDALALDWANYMNFALPDAIWMPVPNLGEDIVEFADAWQLDGVILSGGNDIGENSLRDRTEQLLLEYCIENAKPVLGICRGLQLLQTSLGGKLEQCDQAEHEATQHEVTIIEDPSGTNWTGNRRVNSFHRYGVRVSDLQPSLQALATTRDGWIEAVRLENRKVVGLMWHPEREVPYSPGDKAVIQWLFGCEHRA